MLQVGSAVSLSVSVLLEMFPRRCGLRAGRSLRVRLLLTAQQAGSSLSIPEAACSPVVSEGGNCSLRSCWSACFGVPQACSDRPAWSFADACGYLPDCVVTALMGA